MVEIDVVLGEGERAVLGAEVAGPVVLRLRLGLDSARALGEQLAKALGWESPLADCKSEGAD